jgi:hypothetical protein
MDQMGGCKKASSVTILAIDGFQHGADGSLAISSGNMDHRKLVLRIAQRLGKAPHSLDAILRAAFP